MSRYRETLTYLYGLQYRGMKFGLRNIRSLLDAAGRPERLFPSIHIAGTNGKGSTAAFLASIFFEAGAKTGLYTSPHLIRFTERIRVNGEEIPEGRLVEYVRLLRPAIEKAAATFFEATTCIAFLYFADEAVDVAIIEAGLGGRLDATNVVKPLVSLITNVSIEHTEYLGTTIRAISREKAGIIKKGIPVVTAANEPAVLEVLRRTAFRRGSRLLRSRRLVRVTGGKGTPRVGFVAGGMVVPSCAPGLSGGFQHENAALAVAAIQILRRSSEARRAFPGLTPGAIRRGLMRVRMNTGLQARLQSLSGKFRLLLDVAHNPEGMRTLALELRGMKQPPRVAVFGVMKDKEYGRMIEELAGVVPCIVAVSPVMKRALPARDLCKEGKARGHPLVYGGSVAEGLKIARRLAGTGRILIAGSHYVAGETLRNLYGENA